MNTSNEKIVFTKEQQEKMLKWPNFHKSTIDKISTELSKAEDSYYSHAGDFESKWGEYIDSTYNLSSNSGTSSLHSAWFSLNLDKDSEVLVPTYTYWASIVPMRYYDLVPVFCDVDPSTGIIDLRDAKNRLTLKTKAILIVHLWGIPANMDEVIKFATENGLKIIEDVAHAHGASWKDKKLGTYGDIGIFSFQASKLMPTIEGGMLCTSDKTIYERAVSLGHYLHINSFPKKHKLSYLKDSCLGNKYRIHPLSALLGKCELEYLDENNKSISETIEYFHNNLKKLKGISIPFVNKNSNRVYYTNTIHIDYSIIGIKQEELKNILHDKGCIFGRLQYPLQHTLGIYQDQRYWYRLPVIKGNYLGAKELLKKELSLPRFSTSSLELMINYKNIFNEIDVFKI